ncbi:MAG: hypothetical protein PHN50_01405 [Bacteroidales bacterium]|nr:hypothetical protein [Bacteroidales bacterium]
MKKYLIISFTVLLVLQMNLMKATASTKKTDFGKENIQLVINELKQQSEADQWERIERSVYQLAQLWTTEDGSFEDFRSLCATYNAKNASEREQLFLRIQDNFELLWGSFNKMNVGLKIPLHVDDGEILEVDRLFGGYSPGAHLTSDFFKNKIAFIVQLNFPNFTLKEKTKLAPNWSRLDWAYARMGDVFTARIPATLLQNYAQLSTDADSYISDYNIFMGNLRDNKGQQLFPNDLKLITHWGLRDELKTHYGSKDGLEKQAMIYAVMERIINQEIPIQVINNDEYLWNPFTNMITKEATTYRYTFEPNTRYRHLLNLHEALREIDAYTPNAPSYIQRQFDESMEIPVNDAEKLFVSLLSDPILKDVAKIIEKRMGRKLQPWDIWYDGFKTRSSLDINKIDAILKAKYPDKASFEADLPNILIKLGFNTDSAHSLASRVTVDPSRGAGHAWGAAMKGDKARLRTRIGADGMDYKGYNIAIHEFGHNVEQTITLYDVDYYMLNGVPNTSFTEALAFAFQARDLELLDMEVSNLEASHLAALDQLWSNYEIMGVSLVDIRVWKWLYDNPGTDELKLKEAVTSIAKEVWNTFYAPVFGVKGSPILAVYSHMIDNPLYLSAYPIGQLIEFQFGQYISDKDFAAEVYKAFRQGRLTPQEWMKGAVGEPISTKPVIEAAEEAVQYFK